LEGDNEKLANAFSGRRHWAAAVPVRPLGLSECIQGNGRIAVSYQERKKVKMHETDEPG
jgi:hypothetical protein